jgi:hypothetical protein
MDLITAIVAGGAVLAAWDAVRRLTVSNKRFEALKAENKLLHEATVRAVTELTGEHLALDKRTATLELAMTGVRNLVETA